MPPSQRADAGQARPNGALPDSSPTRTLRPAAHTRTMRRGGVRTGPTPSLLWRPAHLHVGVRRPGNARSGLARRSGQRDDCGADDACAGVGGVTVAEVELVAFGIDDTV